MGIYMNGGAEMFNTYCQIEICEGCTWKWGDDTHRASCLKRGSRTLANSAGSITSRISSNSLRNITSFGLCTLGQNFRRPAKQGKVKIVDNLNECNLNQSFRHDVKQRSRHMKFFIDITYPWWPGASNWGLSPKIERRSTLAEDDRH